MHKTFGVKLAILTDGIYPYVIGGMQKHSFYLTKFLVELGVDVTLYHCVTKGEVPTEKQVKEDLEIPFDAQFRSVCIGFPKGTGMPGHYVRANYVYSINHSKDILEQKFDFIYAKGFAAWHLLELKRKNKTELPPIGVKFHGYEMFQDAPNFKTKLQHYLLRGPVKFNNKHADFVFSYGGKITPIVESLGVNKNSIIEIPTGIAASWLRDASELNESQNRLLFIGRYERRKGIEELNKALTEVMDETSFQVDFIGPIPGSKMLKHPRIKYHGTIMDQNELKKLMDQCGVLLCPSHSEGMPNVIMEGMARGLAVLATDVGAVPIQVDDKNGWRIAPANVKELAETLRKIDTIPAEELMKKRLFGLAKIKNQFTWEKVALQTKNHLEQISSSIPV